MFGSTSKSLIHSRQNSHRHSPSGILCSKIHSDPDVVIPLLIGYLDDDRLDSEAATALGNFGSLAKAAIPKIVPLLKARDNDDRLVAQDALKKIDSEAARDAGVK